MQIKCCEFPFTCQHNYRKFEHNNNIELGTVEVKIEINPMQLHTHTHTQ